MRRRKSERGHLQENPDVKPDPPPTEKGQTRNASESRAKNAYLHQRVAGQKLPQGKVGDALVPVRERMVACQADAEHRCLVEHVGVELDAAEPIAGAFSADSASPHPASPRSSRPERPALPPQSASSRRDRDTRPSVSVRAARGSRDHARLRPANGPGTPCLFACVRCVPRSPPAPHRRR